jgi:4-amino-4-deoxy-L-arabinose transferase-like glycosyltransferase
MPPVSTARLRAFLVRRWPPLVATASVLAYAVAILGFGLDYRPLQSDEGVTLGVAAEPSAADVLRRAIDVRHGPPLHYLLVHFSLLWRDDMLGLRLPSALLGILAVGLSYPAGRELLGRAGGAIVSLIVATSPIVIHLGQFARGYTAMIAAAFASLWILLVLLRTGRPWLVPAWVVTALLLVAAHPFGLFALASELAILVVLGLGPRLRGWRLQRRPLIVFGVSLLLGAAALLALRHVYAPLQNKYGVGHGGAVIDFASSGFWDRLGGHVAGTSFTAVQAALGVAVLAGLVVLARVNPRAAIVATIWLGLPLVVLSLLTATSADFAPERHLSFMLPGYAVALAGLVLEVGRRLPGRWAVAGVAACALLIVPGAVAGINDLRDFDSSLREASLELASRFGPHDVMLTTAGAASRGEDPRLYEAYAMLAAPDSSPLAVWPRTDQARGCALVDQVRKRPSPRRVWFLGRADEPAELADALRAAGASVNVFGSFVLASAPLDPPTTQRALGEGYQLMTAAARAQRDVPNFRRVAGMYRTARALEHAGDCP